MHEPASDFVAELQAQGVTLWIDGEQLRVRAPQGALDAKIRAALTQKKGDVMEFLRHQRSTLQIAPDSGNRYASFPLTDLQQSYWFGQTDAFELGNVNPHVYSELEFTGLDIERVREVLRRLIERHDMLRSLVLPSGEQLVLEQVPSWQLPFADLCSLTEVSRQEILERVRYEMSHTFKSTDTWPLFDVRAHQLPLGKVRLHVSVSLVVGDAASLRLLFDEIPALYRQLDVALEPLSSTFRDYVQSLAAFRASVSYQRQEQYWRGRLTELLPAPQLPLIQALSAVERPAFTRRSATLDAETWAEFKKHARATGVFHASALCAAYCTVLARWSKSPNFTLNILDSQRAALGKSVASVFGNYSATTLTSIDAGSAQCFADFARQLHSRRLLDRQNGAVSGVWVLRELNRLHGTASQASMPVVFNSLDSVFEADHDLLAHEVFGHLQTPQVMLDHMVLARGRAVELHWDALEELFPEGLLDAMFAAYQGLVTRLATDASAWALPLYALIAPQEPTRIAPQRQIRSARLTDDIWHSFAQNPERPAVLDHSGTLTYEQLLGRADQIARWLHEQGAEHGRLVAVVMNKGWEQIAAIIAILEVGGAYLPIDARLPRERIRTLLARSNVRLVLTQASQGSGGDWPPSVECFEVGGGSPAAPPRPTRLRTAGDANDLAYVIFTSGSTGEPKGVMIDHRGALNTIDDINQRFGVGASDRVLAVSSLGFDLSVYDVFGLLGVGGSVVLPGAADARDPERLLALLREGVTIWNSVPATMELLVEHLESRGEKLPASLRLVLLSGDWIPVTLPARIRRVGEDIQIVSLGGATEASIWSIAYPIHDVDPAWKSIPYGTSLSNQQVLVLNDALEPCPTWVAGELYIAGVGLALGYLNDPQQTASRFVVHPRSGERLYRTGDWGRYLPDGNVEFLGRDDLQVKIQGYRIELGEVEAVLGRHQQVRAAVVTAVNGGPSGKQLAAYVVPKQAGLAPSDVRAFLAEQLPAYMVPAFVTMLAALPLTANGKVDRKGLPDPLRATRGGERKPASSPHEVELTRLWEAVLQRQPIGVTDDFFELGGSSLTAVRLCALVEQKLGRHVTVSQLLRAPTIYGMSQLFEQALETAPTCFVSIRERAARQRLILVHPVGGNVVCYRKLAELLPNWSIHGLQARELESPLNLEQIAAQYIRELSVATVEPGWLIGGWSFGGVVAAEMAAQLAQSRREVAGVVLLDSLLPPEGLNPGEPWLVERFLADLGAPFDLCTRGAEWARLGGAGVALERALPDLNSGGIGAERLMTLFKLFVQNQRALLGHVPRPIAAPMLFVRANQSLFEGWRDPAPLLRVAGAQVDERVVDASHLTLLSEPAVVRVAECVAEFLTALPTSTRPALRPRSA